MVWLSVRDVMGLPPKQSRRIYSETEIPAASACLASLSFSSALSRKVRRASKRPLPLLSSSILSSFSLECEKRSAERSESRGEAFGRMLRLLSDRRHPARKNTPRRVREPGLFPLTSGFWCFHFWEDLYRKNDIICQQKRKLLSIGFLWTNIFFVKNKKWKIFQIIKKSFLSRYIRE